MELEPKVTCPFTFTSPILEPKPKPSSRVIELLHGLIDVFDAVPQPDHGKPYVSAQQRVRRKIDQLQLRGISWLVPCTLPSCHFVQVGKTIYMGGYSVRGGGGPFGLALNG